MTAAIRRQPFILALFVIAVCALFLRLAVLMQRPAHPEYAAAPYSDEINYLQLSENLIAFKTFAAYAQGFFVSSTRPPVYPAVHSCVDYLLGSFARAHHLLNLVLDVGNTLLVGMLALRLFGRRSGVVAATIYACFGPAFVYLPAATSEILVVFLILTVMLLLLSAPLIGVVWRIPAVSLVYAILVHTRPAFLLTIPVVPVVLALNRRVVKGARPWRSGLLALVLIGLLCAPWAWRNVRRHGVIVPVCTLAGWHVAAHARSLEMLPVDRLWDYVYHPDRRAYTEGMYFAESTAESLRMMAVEPLKTSAVGTGRLVAAWGFPRAWWRMMDPRAYVYPTYLGDTWFVPLVDFEGVCYAAFVVLAIVLSRVGRAVLGRRLLLWLRSAAPIIVFVSGYTVVHILSVPMIQYRFVVEPLIIVIVVGLIFQVDARRAGLDRRADRAVKGAAVAATGGVTAAIALYCVLYVSCYGKGQALLDDRHAAAPVEHGAPPNGAIGYRELRDEQWRHSGKITDRPYVVLSGQIRYVADGYTFGADSIPALRTSGAVAKLFIEKYSAEHPFGIGDVKLNFSAFPDALQDGDIVEVRGFAFSDPFREPIVEVDDFRTITAFRQGKGAFALD